MTRRHSGRFTILKRVVLASILCGVTNGWSAELSPTERALLKRVDDHYNHLHTLRTEFTETYDGLGLHRVESGTMLLSKPGRMRWSYTQPKDKLFVLDTHYAYSYAPGDAQAQRLPAKQLDDLRSPLRLLLGHTELRRELVDITVAPKPDGSLAIAGTPAGPPAQLKHLELTVDPNGRIQELQLTDQDGSETHFSFHNTEENVPVQDSDFTFSPPIGVPIVNGLPPV